MLYRALKLFAVAAAAIFAGHAMKRAAEGKKRLITGAARDTKKSFDIAGWLDVENRHSTRAHETTKAKATEKFREMLKTRADIMNAVDIDGIGQMDFRFEGVAHTREGVAVKRKYHGSTAWSIFVLKYVPEILVYGKKEPSADGKSMKVTLGSRSLYLKKEYDGKPSNWFVSVYPLIDGQTVSSATAKRRLAKGFTHKKWVEAEGKKSAKRAKKRRYLQNKKNRNKKAPRLTPRQKSRLRKKPKQPTLAR
jgi:hypothetical protein